MPTPAAPQELKALIFDFDGTLADSYAAITASVNHVRGLRGLPPLAIGEVKRHVGRGTNHLLNNTVSSGDVGRDLKNYAKHHPTVMGSLTHLLPGAKDVLAIAKQTGRRVAICSNKPRDFTCELLKALGIASLVDITIGPEDVAKVKPSPDMLLLALETLRQRSGLAITAAQVLYVGDMTVDIDAARAAGIPVWVVPTGSDTLESLQKALPDRLLENLAELANWLKS